MSFGNPGFLWALLLLSIPILIHFFRFRKYKKILFTQTFFLEQTQIQQKRIKNLKHLLVLTARLLALMTLVIAFSLPILAGKRGTNSDTFENKNIVIFIDNHLGFFFADEQGRSKISDIKTAALRLLSSVGDFQKISILTLDNQSEDFFRREDAERFIQSIRPAGKLEDFSTISKKIERHIKNELNTPSIFIIGDFIRRADDITAIHVPFTPVPVKPVDPSEVVAIDTIWREFGTGRYLATPVHLTDHTYFAVGLEKRILFTLRKDNIENGHLSFYIPKTAEASYGFIEPENNLNPVRRFYFSTAEKERKKILVLTNFDNVSEAVKRKFSTMQTADVNYADVRQFDPSAISDYRTVILLHLNEITDKMRIQLIKVLNENGRILIIPASEADVQSYNRLLQQFDARMLTSKKEFVKPDKIEYNDFLFKDVFTKEIDLPDLPFFNQVYPLEGAGILPVLYTLSGQTLLGNISNPAGGYMYIFAGPIDLSTSNLIIHTIFNPLMFNFLHKNTSNSNLYYLSGREYVFVFSPENNPKDEPIKILTPSGDEIIPYQTRRGRDIIVYFGKEVEQNGEYIFTYQGIPIDQTVFNFDLKLLNKSVYTIDELSKLLSIDSTTIQTLSDTNPKSVISGLFSGEFWYFFATLSVLFLIAELLIIRFMS